MRLVLQRVKRASVTVDEEVVGEIGKGMLVLVGIHRDDVDADAAWCLAVHNQMSRPARRRRDVNLSVTRPSCCGRSVGCPKP